MFAYNQDLFYDKMIADPRVSYFFEGIDMKKQRAHQVIKRTQNYVLQVTIQNFASDLLERTVPTPATFVSTQIRRV